MNIIRGLFLTSLLAFTSTAAFADSANPTSPAPRKATLRKAKRVATREPASEGSSSMRVSRRVPRERDWEFQIAGLGGVTSVAAGNTQNGSFGGMVDVRAYKYFGMEADGFYASAPTQTTAHFDALQGKLVNNSQAQRQYSVQGALKGQLPVRWQSIQWTPKLGVGYGLLGMRTSATNADGSSSETAVNAYGPYAVVGLDIEPITAVLISADYSHSFAASGTAGSISTTSARFDRIRAGAYYHFTRNFMAGGQYQRRNLSYSVSGISDSETLNQFLGVAALTF